MLLITGSGVLAQGGVAVGLDGQHRGQPDLAGVVFGLLRELGELGAGDVAGPHAAGADGHVAVAELAQRHRGRALRGDRSRPPDHPRVVGGDQVGRLRDQLQGQFGGHVHSSSPRRRWLASPPTWSSSIANGAAVGRPVRGFTRPRVGMVAMLWRRCPAGAAAKQGGRGRTVCGTVYSAGHRTHAGDPTPAQAPIGLNLRI
jgi:hypothetical protein